MAGALVRVDTRLIATRSYLLRFAPAGVNLRARNEERQSSAPSLFPFQRDHAVPIGRGAAHVLVHELLQKSARAVVGHVLQLVPRVGPALDLEGVEGAFVI